MIICPEYRMGQYRDDDHREDATHFIKDDSLNHHRMHAELGLRIVCRGHFPRGTLPSGFSDFENTVET